MKFVSMWLGLLFAGTKAIDDSSRGYLVFCPCMGRFGNQADHYLGSAAFAKSLNRTLVLPPFVEYRPDRRESVQVPFSTYFEPESMSKFVESITMEKFMSDVAPKVWPPESRVSFCHTERESKTPTIEKCNAKSGNPFGPFWSTYNIDFVKSELYGKKGLYYDSRSSEGTKKWRMEYPPDKWPVLAFTGAPASFPIQPENIPLQKYLAWNEKMLAKANKWIGENLPNAPFVGIHLRNGVDWKRACRLVPSSGNLFSSPQCVGYNMEKGRASPEMCFPTKETIVKKLRNVVKNIGAKSVFVASDNDHMIPELSRAFKNSEISFHKLKDSNPHIDLIILGKSNHFIGNCVSSFTAFVKRERDVFGLPSSFFGFPAEKRTRDEL